MDSLLQIYHDTFWSSVIDENNPWVMNSDKEYTHSYIVEYENWFAKYRHRKIRLIEVGVQGGISLILWAKYFENAEILGIDINGKNLQTKAKRFIEYDPNIKFIEADATKPAIRAHLSGKYDIIIDDGSHDFSHQIATYLLLRDLLSDDGLYVIEDVQCMEEAEWLSSLIPNSRIVDLRAKKGRYDDIMVIVGG